LVVLVALLDENIPFAGESLGIMEISGFLRAQKRAAVEMFDMQLASIEDVLDYLKLRRPALLGFSVKYNTLKQLLAFYERIQCEIPRQQRPVHVVGNALPAYIDELLLREMLPDTIIGLGDGEVCMGDLFDFVQGARTLDSVRNVSYLVDGKIVRRPIVRLPEAEHALPDRRQSKAFYERGGLIYVERSRGCHWGRCTFCPRQHEPIEGSELRAAPLLRRGSSWRARENQRAVEDLRQLQALGISVVRFADEEFIGPGLRGIQLAREFAQAVIGEGIRIEFDVIAKVDSVCNHGDDTETRIARRKMWFELVAAGLVKVALGVETFDPEQIRRYAKGVTLEETHEAIHIVRHDLNLELEIGFITVDPLSTLESVARTLSELSRSQAELYASTAFKEMRVYHGTPYLEMVRIAERRTGRALLGPLDLNSLEYPVLSYVHDDVDVLVRQMRDWNQRCYELFYLLRVYTNCSTRGQADRKAFRVLGYRQMSDLIECLRELEFGVLLQAIAALREAGGYLEHAKFAVAEVARRGEAERSERIARFAALLHDSPPDEATLYPLKRAIAQYEARRMSENRRP
jgi:radical SAM superfamily enzyme YgiQ (UPF0313 family)